jgi:hypothetical protein
MDVALFDLRPIVVTIASDGEYPEWRTTVHDLRHSPVPWRQMHVANWNRVAEPMLHEGLDSMFAHYRYLLASPLVWAGMTTADWDLVPQPMRIVAYRQMCGYWAEHYGIAARYHLAPEDVTDTLAAIVMSESWFDHRATSNNADGSRDIGLGQASNFARERIRHLYAHRIVDVRLTDDQYYNPWTATRFVALWMSLLLDETGGNLDLAVRAYNRGVAHAGDAIGTWYRDVVHSRLVRFIRNTEAPVAWSYLWWKAHDLEQQALRPAISIVPPLRDPVPTRDTGCKPRTRFAALCHLRGNAERERSAITKAHWSSRDCDEPLRFSARAFNRPASLP